MIDVKRHVKAIQTAASRIPRQLNAYVRPQKTQCSPATRASLTEAGLGRLLVDLGASIEEYQIVPNRGWRAADLVGISAFAWGRLGNVVITNINAIAAAKHLNLRHVVLCQAEDFLPDKTMLWDELLIHGSAQQVADRGRLLHGPFWEDLRGFPDVPASDYRAIAYDVVRHYLRPPARMPHEPDPHELTIHMRGGDIFQKGAFAEYTQPPLAFYKRALGKAVDEHGVQRVRIVSEDNLNPCVDALIAFLAENGTPCVYQSTSPREDFLTIARAHHVVFAYGTFAPAACLISANIKSIYTFNGGRIPDNFPFRWVDRLHAFYDASGNYIRKGEWRNDETQLRQMVNYPAAALSECAVPLTA